MELLAAAWSLTFAWRRDLDSERQNEEVKRTRGWDAGDAHTHTHDNYTFPFLAA